MVEPLNSDLLLNCLQQDDSQQDSRLAQYTERDWRTTLDLARQHGLLPLLAGRLFRLFPHQNFPVNVPVNLPENTRQQLQESLRNSAARNLRLYHALGEIIQALSQANLPFILLKGAHLAELVYPDFSLRPMGDIDILVKQGDLEAASQVLTHLGYAPYRRITAQKAQREHHHLPPFIRADSPWVEIHWTIVLHHSPITVDLPGIWQRAQPATIEKTPVLILAPEDLLLHLCLHLCQDDFQFGLRPVCDIAETLSFYQKDLDWEALLCRAAQWGAKKCLFLALYLSHQLLSAPLPHAVLDTLRPDDFDPAIAALAREKTLQPLHPAALHPDLAGFWGNQPWQSKLKSLLKLLFPPREYLADKYSLPRSSKILYLYHLKRWKDLSFQYWGQLWRLLRREPAALALAKKQNLVKEWWMPK